MAPSHRRTQPCGGNFSNMDREKYGNSYTSMLGDKCYLYRNSRTRPYYFRRCKRVQPTKIESLPDELLFEILVRLPADYLHDEAIFVCRRWSHIIHSYDFVNTQIHSSTYGLLLCSRAHEFLPHAFVYPKLHPIFVTATQGEARIERRDICYTHRRRFFGSTNGLALNFSFRDRSMYISNPAIKRELLLPTCPRKCCHHGRCAIGYAAASMKYKVIIPYNKFFLAILTVGVDKSWRDIPMGNFPMYARFLDCPVATEGFIHWTRDDDISFILTLDVETEIFTMSSTPHHNLKTRNTFLSTGRFLSLLISHKDFSWEVWVMKSRNQEWSKLLPDIELGGLKCMLQQFACGEDDVLKPLGWVKYPEVLAFFFDGRSCSCILYNLYTHEINSIKLPDPVRYYSACVHKNNLIWFS